jgi:tetratricopeptide (TPR) repeat protein
MYPYCFDEALNPCQISHLLNDRGAQFIEQGDYELAIEHLAKALKVYEPVAGLYDTCRCKHCRLDCCVSSSQQKNRRSFVQGCHKVSSSDDDSSSSSPSHDDGGYVYRRPIFCSPTFSQEGHYPGVTLLLIIIFNLALAHHLLSISINQPHACHETLSRALQLYEVFYQLQMEREIFSTQTTLAVANNVGEIHRIVGNHSKYILCLEHLLSCIMLVVEDQQSSGSSSSTTSISGLDTPSTTSCQAEEMEGFLRNATQLVLNNNCASAA